VEKARRYFERNKQLHESHLVSQEVYDDSLTDYELSKNSLELAESTLSQLEVQISKTRIVAPVDCTVLTRPVSVGQAVSGSGGVGGGTEIMTIANLKEMIITAHMNQADVPRLRLGQSVNVEVEAVPGMKIKGTVERIAPQATIKNNIKGFATQIRLKNLEPVVRPGMTANMTIPLQSAENAVAIPLAAVFSEENDRYTFVRNQNGEFEIRPIRIGVADFQYAEVLDGLQNGDIVSLVRPEKFVGDLHEALSKDVIADRGKLEPLDGRWPAEHEPAAQGHPVVLKHDARMALEDELGEVSEGLLDQLLLMPLEDQVERRELGSAHRREHDQIDRDRRSPRTASRSRVTATA